MVFSSLLFSPTSPPNQKMCWLKGQSSTLDFEHILLVLKMTMSEKLAKSGMMQDNGIESSKKSKKHCVFLDFVLVYEVKENKKKSLHFRI